MAVLWARMMHAPRGIVFDLDGTLIDSGGDIVAAVNHALRRTAGRRCPRRRFGVSWATARAALRSRRRTAREASRGRQSARDATSTITSSTPPSTPSGCRTRAPCSTSFAATSSPSPPTSRARRPTPCSSDSACEAFSPRSSRRAISPAKKPSPLPILEIAKQLGIEPRQLVMVGDGPQDIEAGRRAGCRTIGVQGGFLAPERLVASQPDVSSSRWPSCAPHLSRWSDATVTAQASFAPSAPGRTTTSRMPLLERLVARLSCRRAAPCRRRGRSSRRDRCSRSKSW